MIRQLGRLGLGLALAACAAGSASAQGVQTGTLRGTVTDPSGKGVASVEVTLSSPDLQEHVSLTARGSALLRKLLVQSGVR